MTVPGKAPHYRGAGSRTAGRAVTTHPRRLATAGAAGAAGLLAHLAARPLFDGPGAWRVPGVPPGASAAAYHLVETVPVVLALAGVLALERVRSVDPEPARQGGGTASLATGSGRRLTGRRRIETTRRAGYALTVGGAHASIYAHFGAHLLPAVPLASTPLDDGLVTLYLGAWLLAVAGLGVYGVAVLAAGDAPATGATVAATPVLGFLAGATVVALGGGSVGDGPKLAFALATAAAAAHAWAASDAGTADAGRRVE